MSTNFITGVNNIFTSNTNAKTINISAGTNELLNINANSVTGLNNISLSSITGLVPTISNTQTYSQTVSHTAANLGPIPKSMCHLKLSSYPLVDFLVVTLPNSASNNSGGLVIYDSTSFTNSYNYLYNIIASAPTTAQIINFGNTISADRYGSGYFIVTEPVTQSMFLYISEYPNAYPWILDEFFAPNNTIYDSIASTPQAIVSSSIAKIAGNYIISADSTGIVNLTLFSSSNSTTKLFNNANGAVVAIGITGQTIPISAFVQNNYLYVYLSTNIQQVLYLGEAGVDIDFDNTGHYMYVLTASLFNIYYTSSLTSLVYMRIHSINSYGAIQLSSYSNASYNYVSYLNGSNQIVTFVNNLISTQPDLFLMVGTFNTSGQATSLNCFCMTDTDVFAGDKTTNNSYIYLTTSTTTTINNNISDGLTYFNTTTPISFNDLFANNAAVTNVSANNISAVTFSGQYLFNFLYAGLQSNQNPTNSVTFVIPFTDVNVAGFGSFNNTTGILTFLQGGYYFITANVALTSTNVSTVYGSFVVNGSTTINTLAVSVNSNLASLPTIGASIYHFNSGDNLEITTFGTGVGSNYSIIGGNTYTNMTIIKVS